MTARTFLVSGLLAGLLAGIAAFVVAFTLGEPSIDKAIALEDAASAAHHDHAEQPVVTRQHQATWGLATATIVLGTMLGGATGVTAAGLTGRLGRLTPPAAGVLATGIGFLTFGLVPFLKYPPNPPAVGNPNTIDERTATYFGLIAVALLAAVMAVVIVRELIGRGIWTATVVAGAGYVLIISLAAVLLPPIHEAPDSFPANTLYDFRIGSLMTQGTLWLTMGVTLSGLLARSWRAARADQTRRDLAAAL